MQQIYMFGMMLVAMTVAHGSFEDFEAMDAATTKQLY